MQGLVAYESSDEEETGPHTATPKVNGTVKAVASDERHPQDPLNDGKPVQSLAETSGVTQGPAAGSTAASPGPATDAPDREESPEATSRRIMQNLTLPPVPHIDIPPSPPGSPDPAITAKVQRFLELKKQGVHYNETLASKPALRNPSMFSNLMDFAGIGEKESYASALPPELQVGGPDGFHESQYVESLEADRKKKDEAHKKGRDKIEFSKSSQVAGSKRARE